MMMNDSVLSKVCAQENKTLKAQYMQQRDGAHEWRGTRNA